MNHVAKTRVDTLTYGLIYPAFLGNMIYDLMLRKLSWNDGVLEGPDLMSCFAVVFFLLIDYMHLNGDMNKIADAPEKKSWRYILCDIGTCCLIFSSFVLFKEGYAIFALMLFSVIPVVILTYKQKNSHSARYFKWYSVFSEIAFIVSLLVYYKGVYFPWIYPLIILIHVLVYGYYLLYHYYDKCYEGDKDIVKEDGVY
jgi:hypothetical protein